VRLSVLAALLLFSGCLNAGAKRMSQPQAANAEQSIIRFYQQWFGALEAGEPEALLALLDTDFVLKTPLGPPISDRNQLRGLLTGMTGRVRQEIDWKIEDYRLAGDWAWVRVSESAKHVPKAGGEPTVYTGSHLSILRRVSGRWLLHRDQASLNEMPSPTPP
jgi:ketosteroid isomerase-like protein